MISAPTAIIPKLTQKSRRILSAKPCLTALETCADSVCACALSPALSCASACVCAAAGSDGAPLYQIFDLGRGLCAA